MRIKIILASLLIITLIPLYGCQNEIDNIDVEKNNSSPSAIEVSDTVHDVVLGGSAINEWSTPYSLIYYGIPTFLFEIVGKEKIDEWESQFRSSNNPNGRDHIEFNVVKAVNELNISKEDFLKGNKEWSYSKEQVDAMFSKDQKQINRAFVNPGALLHNDEIYTANWLEANDIYEYEKEGITEEVLNKYLEKIKDTPLKEQHDKIKIKMEKKNN